MRTDFLRMVEASQKGQEQPSNIPTGEETPPTICDITKCKIVACPQRNNPDQVGQPCIYYTKPNIKNPPMPHDCSLDGLERSLEKALEQAFKPITDRLEAIEKHTPINRSFNGSPIPVGFPRLYRESLRGDTIHD